MESISTYQTLPNSRKPIGKTVSPLANSFSLVEMNTHLRFLIMDCPTDSTLSLYLKEFARLNVTDVVRVCEPTYNTEKLTSNGVNVHPPANVIKGWIQLVNARDVESAKKIQVQPVPTTIAVHCVAGLGRAPVLVAVALIEQGLDPIDVIELIRRKRRGAFNNKQISYLVDRYKRSSSTKAKTASNKASSGAASSMSLQGSEKTGKDSSSKSFFKKMFGGSH
ncbi:putative protein tyrosine phosphatase type IVA A [Smittium culicis]|uniref:Tyrosine specific protein phosphatases domain-containing protein n=1 Tax=Smittium culicis TaxID=133412 RepID=A0A1R1XMS2_9FUNG|nr:putative protein tyrosine phosphatase type IVA A [Smittium culicis]